MCHSFPHLQLSYGRNSRPQLYWGLWAQVTDYLETILISTFTPPPAPPAITSPMEDWGSMVAQGWKPPAHPMPLHFICQMGTTIPTPSFALRINELLIRLRKDCRTSMTHLMLV